MLLKLMSLNFCESYKICACNYNCKQNYLGFAARQKKSLRPTGEETLFYLFLTVPGFEPTNKGFVSVVRSLHLPVYQGICPTSL